MLQAAPCSWGAEASHIIAAAGAVVTACFTAFLAHRRVKADEVARRERSGSTARQYNIIEKLDHIHRKVNGCGPDS